MTPDRPTVLVVDDDRDHRELLRVMLDLAGFHVVTARDGSEALHKLEDPRPAAVVLDLMMPVLDGVGFRLEQQRRDNVRDIPILCLSARHDAVQTAQQLGCAAWFQKPVDLTELVEALRRLCAG
jgi:DNA-binding response OmpR family regulator